MTPVSRDFGPRLRAVLARREPATLAEAGAQRAAVAVVATLGDGPALLFVKRRERSGDPWSGDVAFPGGFAEAGDATPAATAARETEEETGLPLTEEGEVAGVLDDVFPRSKRLPRVVGTPVVFLVPRRLPVAPRDEIERAFWLPVEGLFDEDNRWPLVLELPGGRREFESIVIEGVTIWGLTERILSQLAALLR